MVNYKNKKIVNYKKIYFYKRHGSRLTNWVGIL